MMTEFSRNSATKITSTRPDMLCGVLVSENSAEGSNQTELSVGQRLGGIPRS